MDPVFNHTMVYDGIREVDLTEACVELTVWDRDRLANNLLGGLRLGAGTGNCGGVHPFFKHLIVLYANEKSTFSGEHLSPTVMLYISRKYHW